MSTKWLNHDIRMLSSEIDSCQKHIIAGTFDEEVFSECLKRYQSYFEEVKEYTRENGCAPSNTIDESAMCPIAAYYNSHTKTTTRYDERTIEDISSPTYHKTVQAQSTEEWHDDVWIKWLLYAVGAIILYGMLRGCSRGQAETIAKKYFDDNKERVEFQDPNYIPYNMEEEVIRPGDYPIRKLK